MDVTKYGYPISHACLTESCGHMILFMSTLPCLLQHWQLRRHGLLCAPKPHAATKCVYSGVTAMFVKPDGRSCVLMWQSITPSTCSYMLRSKAQHAAASQGRQEAGHSRNLRTQVIQHNFSSEIITLSTCAISVDTMER